MILDHFNSGGQAAGQFETAHGVSRRAFIRAGAAAGGIPLKAKHSTIRFLHSSEVP